MLHTLAKRALTLSTFAMLFASCASSSAEVSKKSQPNERRCGSKTRTHYIAADSVAWNYAPAGKNLISGAAFTDDENVFVGRRPGRIGSVYTKSMYREYTDSTFTKLVTRPAAWEHLGFLGPIIHAEVGDRIKVVFKNNTPFPASMHPHGVFYTKSAEGAPYADGTHGTDNADDAVTTGASHTYNWEVPERAGPAEMDKSSVMWMYHSHTDEIADTYAGLMGPMVVTRCGMARDDGSPKDVDREIVNVFTVENENLSPWIQQNLDGVPPVEADTSPAGEDEGFEESNLMHSINGFVYGNLPAQTMRVSQRVRWYVMAMGTEVDLHTPHWHGNTVVANGMRTDVISLLPASMMIADMVPDNPGKWLYHCHVNDHIAAGMSSMYTVSA